MKVMFAMVTIQSSGVENATSQNKLLFALYMLLLLLVALVSWLLWRSGNRLQDVIRVEANARIAEADSKAASANERAGKANAAAGTANQRAGELEKANLTLRGQVATLETAATDAKIGLVGLQKAADDAKAEQQRVQTELTKQQKLTADAITAQAELRRNFEKEIADAKSRQAAAEATIQELRKSRPRTLSASQREDLTDRLSLRPLPFNFAPEIRIKCWAERGYAEGCSFAEQLFGVFQNAGWNPVGGALSMDAKGVERLTVRPGPGEPTKKLADSIKAHFERIGYPVEIDLRWVNALKENQLELIVPFP